MVASARHSRAVSEPAAPAADAARPYLPLAHTSFIGRERELVDLRQHHVHWFACAFGARHTSARRESRLRAATRCWLLTKHVTGGWPGAEWQTATFLGEACSAEIAPLILRPTSSRRARERSRSS